MGSWSDFGSTYCSGSLPLYDHFYLWNDNFVVLIWSVNPLKSGGVHKNMERHTADTIVSWPNPKQWVIVHVGQVSAHTNSRWAIEFYLTYLYYLFHDDVIKWKHFRVTGPLYGEFTGHRWIPLTKANDRELWCFLWSVPWVNGWVHNRKAGELRPHRAHYDVIVISSDDGMLLDWPYYIYWMQHCFISNRHVPIVLWWRERQLWCDRSWMIYENG